MFTPIPTFLSLRHTLLIAQRLVELLTEARVGNVSKKTEAMMKERERTYRPGSASSDSSSDIIPTRLECKNVDVDASNNSELAKLPSPLSVFNSVDWKHH